jgi:dTDP-4-amino-4,6-dideoxygalactose transaminase
MALRFEWDQAKAESNLNGRDLRCLRFLLWLTGRGVLRSFRAFCAFSRLLGFWNETCFRSDFNRRNDPHLAVADGDFGFSGPDQAGGKAESRNWKDEIQISFCLTPRQRTGNPLKPLSLKLMKPTLRAEKRILLSVPHMGGAEARYVQEAFESANPILYEGGVPVFIDSESATWNLDPNLLSEFLRKRARAGKLPQGVCVVHLFGQSADLDSILEVCRRYELPLLEDAAESLGARYKGRHPGTFGDVGVFSFNGNKMITGTTGGMLVSPRKGLVEKARHWGTQARDPDPLGVNNYVHSAVGYNYRMSNVVAGIVRGQLEVLEERVRQRRAIFERYRVAFADLDGIEPQPEAGQTVRQCDSATAPAPTGRRNGAPMHRHTRWLSCFLVDEAKFGMSAMDLIRYLDGANVESRPVWKPMHTQPLYQKYECIGGHVAEDLNRRGICLPSSSSLTEEEQAFVIERVMEAARKSGKQKVES